MTEFACIFCSCFYARKLQCFENPGFRTLSTLKPRPQTVAIGVRQRDAHFATAFHFRRAYVHRENPRKAAPHSSVTVFLSSLAETTTFAQTFREK